MSTTQETGDERAPLLPTSSPTGDTVPQTNQPDRVMEAEDPVAIAVNKELTTADIAWRIIFITFGGLLAAITIKAVVDTGHTDVRSVSLWHMLGLHF